MICNDIYIGCIEIIWVTLELFGTSHFPCDCYLAPNPDGLLLIRKLNHKPLITTMTSEKLDFLKRVFWLVFFIIANIFRHLCLWVDWFWFLQVSVSWQSAWRFGKERKASVYVFNIFALIFIHIYITINFQGCFSNKLRPWQPTKIIGRHVLFRETNRVFTLIYIDMYLPINFSYLFLHQIKPLLKRFPNTTLVLQGRIRKSMRVCREGLALLKSILPCSCWDNAWCLLINSPWSEWNKRLITIYV